MSEIILPRRFKGQPQYAAPLDKRHNYFKRIRFAYSAGRGPHDGAHGIGSITGTITYGVGPKGKNIKPADASSYLAFANNPDYNILGDITVIARIRTAGLTVQQGIVTKCETTGGANTPFGLFTESGGAISFNRSNSGFRVWQSATTLSTGQSAIIAVTQVTDISVPPKFYVDGVLDTGSPTSLYSGSGTGAATGNTTSLKIGNRTDLASQCYHEIYDVQILDGVLSDSEVAEYIGNPYAIWQAPPRRIWAVASGTPSSFNPAWARNANVMIGTMR